MSLTETQSPTPKQTAVAGKAPFEQEETLSRTQFAWVGLHADRWLGKMTGGRNN